MNYCNSLFNYQRRKTTTALIGSLSMGGLLPVRIQTMANTDTNNIENSVAQAKRVVIAGSELLRYTTQGVLQAENLGIIRQQLHQQNINIPLVADVHFNPKVAEVAAALVEKVRINPGNFVNSVTNNYTEQAYNEELERVEQKLIPLIQICKEHGTAIRIGVNHGSLSPRIVARYGDTPQGLAASCMEFIHLFFKHQFTNLVISIKASNTLVMVQAVRLLVAQMQQANINLPLHLGVTEAGNGEDGRIKSAVGIGALLADGIGDTIRVSLSEAPENEIPVAQKLVHYITTRQQHEPIAAEQAKSFDPFTYQRRITKGIHNIGGHHVPVVITNTNQIVEPQPDYFINQLPFATVNLKASTLTDKLLQTIKAQPNHVVLLSSNHKNPIGEMRSVFHTFINHNITNPVILCFNYNEENLENLQIKASADCGALLLDGFGDGIYLQNDNTNITTAQINSLAFGILQASRVRMSRTEYISCPGCGRTLFDLQNTVEQVKKATAHLKHLKIAIMGCIVNGPGEMADADYGYVGAGKGKISLYRGTECIEKNIPENQAVEHLLNLIEKDGRG